MNTNDTSAAKISQEIDHRINIFIGAIISALLFIAVLCIVLLSMKSIVKERKKLPITWCATDYIRAPTQKITFGDMLHGKELFDNNCASCHNIHRVMVGPALKGILERRKLPWLIKWVQDPAKIIASKDPYAIQLAKDYEAAGVMTSFKALKKSDITNIIAYIGAY